jgi:hypothetical protein
LKAKIDKHSQFNEYYHKNRKHILDRVRNYNMENAKKIKARRHLYYLKHRKRIIEQNKIWHKKYYQKFPEKSRESSRKSRLKIRKEVLCHYGGNPPKCSCCGESIEAFLTIDHLKGNGAEERRKVKGDFYFWLKKQGFPKGFHRVLCFNCNLGRERNNGICPHEEVKESEM